MLHRILPAVSIVALAGCQPHYTYPQYSSRAGLAGNVAGATTPNASAVSAYKPFQAMTLPTDAASAASSPSATAVASPSLAGGSFHDIDAHAGEVGFWNADPVRKREVGLYSDRYVERITLKNGGMLVYESLNHGDLARTSDTELIKADLDLPGFRQRGITFDSAKLEKVGPFTYLAESSASDNCVIFRAKFRRLDKESGAAPVPEGRAHLNEEAYGNVCYSAQAKDLAAVKAEMVDILSRVRFGGGSDVITAAGSASDGKPTSVAASAEQCPYSVSFSGTPTHEPGQSGSSGAQYSYVDGSYREKATCTCRQDLDYAKVSQFDAVENARAHAEKIGFKLQKATFDDTPELGKQLDYEAVAVGGASDTFLVGRNFYRQCGYAVTASGTSYADLVKARKFIESVSVKSPAAAPTYDVSVTSAKGSTRQAKETAGDGAVPVAAPRAVVSPPTKITPEATGATLPPAKPSAAAARNGEGNAAKETPVVDATTKNAAGSGSSARPADEPTSDEVAVRLRRLNMLLEQQLLTPGEYEAKRKAILDTL